jgi:uncharacterized protein YbaP (TraB family)
MMGQNTLLYEISGNGLQSSSYLFGTYHLLGEKWPQSKPSVMRAFDSSAGVITETTTDSADVMQLMVLSCMKDKKINELISPTVADSLDMLLKQAFNMSLAQVSSFKPMVVVAMLTVEMAKDHNATMLKDFEGMPQDLWFEHEGKQRGKKTYALESLMEQGEILYQSASLEEQAVLLTEVVRKQDQLLREDQVLLTAYMHADFEALDSLLNASTVAYQNLDPLLKDRNEKWMEILPQKMQEQSHFIAVGAMHLIGKVGLIAQLRSAGYVVNPIEMEK